jgi:hypothetical protein
MISSIPNSKNETTGATFHFATVRKILRGNQHRVNGTKVEGMISRKRRA